MSSTRAGGRVRQRGRGGSRNSSPAPAGDRDSRRVRPTTKNTEPSSTSSGSARRSANTSRASTQSSQRRGILGKNNSNQDGSSASGKMALQVDGAGEPSYWERYQRLKSLRERERTNAIRDGILADPNRPRTLKEAIKPVGTCQDMCPEFERVERVVQKDVWPAEQQQSGTSNSSRQRPDESRMVKKFRRAAAGLDEQLPSDLRPPVILKQTVDYLFSDLLNESSTLAIVHHFIWDRTRAIRNDFSIQQITKANDARIAMDCFERIARFHILSLHLLAVPQRAYEVYDAQQEREQLDKTLLSLIQYYDDFRGIYSSPNEAEFRAYGIVFQIQASTPNLEDRMQSWPKSILSDNRIQQALKIYTTACNTTDGQGPLRPRTRQAIAQANWHKFWCLVESHASSYLMSCIAEIYFNHIRHIALHSLWHSFRQTSRQKSEDWTIEELVNVLGFDTEQEAEMFCEQYEFTITERLDGNRCVDLSSVAARSFPNQPSSSYQYQRVEWVERKRFGRTFSAVINGLSVKAAVGPGAFPEEGMNSKLQLVTPAQEESLFIPETATNNPGHETLSQHALPDANMDQPGVSELSPPARPFQPPGTAIPENGKGSSISSNASSLFATTSTFPSTATPPLSFAQPVKGDHFPGRSSAQPNGSAGASHGPVTFTVGDSSAVLHPSNPGLNSQVPMSSSYQNSAASTTSNLHTPLTGFSFPFESKTDSNTKRDSASFPQRHVVPEATVHKSPSWPQQQSETTLTVAHTPNMDGRFSHLQDRGSSLTTSIHGNEENTTQKPLPPFNHASSQPIQSPSSSFSPPNPTTNPSLNPPSNSSLFAMPRSLLPEGESTPVTKIYEATATPGIDLALPSLRADRNSGRNQSHIEDIATTSSFALEAPQLNDSMNASVPEQKQLSSAQSQQLAKENKAHRTAESKKRKSEVLDQLARTMMLESHGFLDQFVEFIIDPMINDAERDIEDEALRQQADDFRRESLSVRFGQRWIQIYWNRRLVRQRRERKRRLAQNLEAKSRSHNSEGIASQLDLFRARSSSPRETSVAFPSSVSTLPNGHSGPLSSVEVNSQNPLRQSYNVSEWSGSTVKQPRIFAIPRRRNTTGSDQAGVINKGNETLIAATPNGGPGRIPPEGSPIDNYSSGGTKPKQPGHEQDTTRSAYFKLKALGMDARNEAATSSTGAPERKRVQADFSRIAKVSGDKRRKLSSETYALQIGPNVHSTGHNSGNEEDEQLFAAVRSAKQAMDESISFFREESAKDNSSSPGAMHAASKRSFSKGVDAKGNETAKASRISKREAATPKYRSRTSKFLPRSQYADVLRQQQKQHAVNSENNKQQAGPSKGQQVEKDRTLRSKNPFVDVDEDGHNSVGEEHERVGWNGSMVSHNGSAAGPSESGSAVDADGDTEMSEDEYGSEQEDEYHATTDFPKMKFEKGGTSIEDAIEL